MTLTGILYVALSLWLIVAIFIMVYLVIKDEKSNKPKDDCSNTATALLSEAIRSLSNKLPELTELLRQQNKDGRNPSTKTTLVSESCSTRIFKVVQSYQCPECHGRGVLVDATGDNAIKCHICKGEGRVEL